MEVINMEIAFLEIKEETNWVKGIVDDGEYTFVAKIYDEGSMYGIEEGRVSKLEIYRGKETEEFEEIVVSYDRGWDVEPTTDEDFEVYKEVLDFLEDSPRRLE